MSKRHLLFFFLDDFHHGAVNHITHFIGFTLLGYGLGRPSLMLIILSPFTMEAGHIYNYLRGIHKEHAIKILPLQLAAWILFVVIGYLMSKLFSR